MNEIISARGVYRTASPTPGLLIISQKLDKKNVLFLVLSWIFKHFRKRFKKKIKKITVEDVGCILYDNLLNFQYIFKNLTTFINLNFSSKNKFHYNGQ